MKNEVLMSEIQATIEKDIPNQVGEALKERLIKAEKDATDLIDCKISIETFREDNTKLRNNITELNTRIRLDGEVHANLKLREDSVSARERNLNVFEANLRVEDSEKRANQALNMVNTVFRSPVFKSTYDRAVLRGAGRTDEKGQWIEGAINSEFINKTDSEE